MNSFRKRLGLENFTAPMRRTRKSEILAWMVVAFQLYVMLSKSPPSEIHDNFQFRAASDGKDKPLSLDMNTRPLEYYEQRRRMSRVPFFESPQVHSKDAGLVSRVWRSNGSPSIHSELQTGSCWCRYVWKSLSSFAEFWHVSSNSYNFSYKYHLLIVLTNGACVRRVWLLM